MRLLTACGLVCGMAIASVAGGTGKVRGSDAPAARPAGDEAAALQRRQAQDALQRYRYEVFPRYLRDLDRRLQFAEAEVRLLAERSRNYRPLTRFGSYSASYSAAEQTELQLLAAELRLAELRDERAALWGVHERNLRVLAAGIR